ncbi:MAG TPA: alpha/beta fold hydrolase [Longimicrobiales bacterium]
MAAEGTQALINGATLHWREAGAGSDVLVLIHGFPFSSAVWRPQLEYAPAGWRIIAPDLRGFGGSGGAAGSRIGMDEYADDVAALLHHLGVRSAVFCGHSMGGYIAFALLRRAAALVRGLILSDTRASPDSPEARQGRLKNAKHILAHGTAALVDAMVPRLLSQRTRETLPHIEQELRAIMGGAPAHGVTAALLGMAHRPDSSPQLRSINVPTLVIVGEQDQITPVGEARLLARAIPGAHLQIIPGAGHVPGLEQSSLFNRVLGEFVEGLRTSAAR